MSATAEATRPRLAVLFGGRSSEHSISCVSAGSVLDALRDGPWEVVPIGITRDGTWVLPGADQSFALSGGDLPEVRTGRPVVLVGDGDFRGYRPLDGGDPVPLDVVFPVLHGPYGEDGTVQGLLEMAGLPYVGSGVFASAAAMDKAHMKALLFAADLPQAPYAVLAGAGSELGEADRERLGLPVFVKPARGGSSVGISKVSRWDQLPAALELARQSDPKVVVEAGVVGREVECGVLGAGGAGAAEPPEASLPAEIKVSDAFEFYDFEAKYLSDSTSFDVPAELPAEVTEALRTCAVRAFQALDCAGLARVDFFVTPDGGIVLNEVNTMPGFTPVSMYPRMWAATGVEYPKLVRRLVELALERGSGLS